MSGISENNKKLLLSVLKRKILLPTNENFRETVTDPYGTKTVFYANRLLYNYFCIMVMDISLKNLDFEEENRLFSLRIKSISEKDLELRGSGEFFGTKQHGTPEFKISNLFQDIETLKNVQSLAILILQEDAKLEQEGYEKYIKAYYESIRMIDEESDVQRYNRLNNEFLTEEEYRQMYPEPIEELREEVDSLTKVLKPRRVKKSKEVPGQLSFFDYMDGGKTR